MRQQRLRLRAEHEAAAGRLGVVERLLPHPVAGQDEPAAAAVPERQRKHAVQARAAKSSPCSS